MSYRRTLTITVPAEIVSQFDEIVPQGESRSSLITQLMLAEIQKNER